MRLLQNCSPARAEPSSPERVTRNHRAPRCTAPLGRSILWTLPVLRIQALSSRQCSMEGTKMAHESIGLPPQVAARKAQVQEEYLAQLNRVCDFIEKRGRARRRRTLAATLVMGLVVLAIGLAWLRHHVDRSRFAAGPPSHAATVSVIRAAPSAPAPLEHPPYATAAREPSAITKSPIHKRRAVGTPVRSLHTASRRPKPTESAAPALARSAAQPPVETVTPLSAADLDAGPRLESAAVSRETDPEPMFVESLDPGEVMPKAATESSLAGEGGSTPSVAQAP